MRGGNHKARDGLDDSSLSNDQAAGKDDQAVAYQNVIDSIKAFKDSRQGREAELAKMEHLR